MINEAPPQRTKPRFPKSAIAAITAGGLLIGGGVTWSLWSDTATGSGTQDLTTGTLTVEAEDGAKVYETTTGSAVEISSPDDFLVVPGESFIISQDFTVELTGDHLTAEVAIETNDGTILGGDSTGWTVGEPVILVNGVLQATPDLELDEDDMTNGEASVSVGFELEFTADDTDNQDATLSANLGGLSVTITQVEPTA